jgi:hypothetical protein
MSSDTPAAPRPEESRELLDDLRNILVTEESRGVREVIAILGQLQSKIEDRQGLIALLAPVLAAALVEAARQDPAALERALAPIVRAIVAEDEDAPAAPPQSSAARALLKPFEAVGERVRTLFARPKPAARAIVVEDAAALAPEVADAEFALVELFLLARPSLALLAHGSWQATHLQLQAEEQMLPLLRRFIRDKTPDQDLVEPLRAAFDRYHVHVEPGKHAHLVVVYEGTPTEGFRLDIRTSLATLHAQSKDALRRAHAVPAYRATLRLLLDRYRPETSRMGAQSRQDPIRWPAPGAAPIATTPPQAAEDAK